MTWTAEGASHEVRFIYDGNGVRVGRITRRNGAVVGKTFYIGGIYERELAAEWSGGELRLGTKKGVSSEL